MGEKEGTIEPLSMLVDGLFKGTGLRVRRNAHPSVSSSSYHPCVNKIGRVGH
jgi:hypothetical protein